MVIHPLLIEHVCVCKDAETQIVQQKENIRQAEERLAQLAIKLQERKELERNEDKNSDKLRRWCLTVRSLVMVPSSPEQALNARPLENGSLSGAMCMVIGDADKLGIADSPDVDVVINAFKCMSWSLFTLAILRRKPRFSEISEIVSLASALKLPEEKGLRTMKTMLQRATQWQSKISKALSPKAGLTRPFKPISLDMLKELEDGVDECPLRIPESTRLRMAIEDKGARYCECGGPTDGTFMVCCDKCEYWFHGGCVGVKREDSEDLRNWLCRGCSGKNVVDQELSTGIPNPSTVQDGESHYESDDDDEEEVPHAPAPARMWPPFGLFGSDTATAALGECSKIPDDFAIDSSTVISVGSGGNVRCKASASVDKPVVPPKRLPTNDSFSKIKQAECRGERHVSAQSSCEVLSALPQPVASDACVVPGVSLNSSAAVSSVGDDAAETDSTIQSGTMNDKSPVLDVVETKEVQMELESEPTIARSESEPAIQDKAFEKEPVTATTIAAHYSVAESEVKDMEVDEQDQEVGTEEKPEDEVVVPMEVEDSSLETRSEIVTKSQSLESRDGEQTVSLPTTQQCDDVPSQAGLNGLRSSTSFTEVSLDQSSATTTEGRGTAQNKEEESSSSTKSEATEARVVGGSLKNPHQKVVSGSVDTLQQAGNALRPCLQSVTLPLGMKVEVKSAGCQANDVEASALTSDATSPSHDGTDANLSCDDPLQETSPAAVAPLLANVLVAMKDASA